MGKIEIDNVKMLESILGFEAEVKTEDLMNNPTSVAIKFINDAIKKALEDQGLEYKDGSLHYIGEEEVKKPEPVNFEDFPREEQLKWYICIKSIPQKDGGFMPLFCEGEQAPIEKIFSMCPELRNDVALFVEYFRKVTEDDLPKKPSTIKFELDIEDGINAMVNEFFWTHIDTTISSHTRAMMEEAYRQGLEDMWDKLKGRK